MTKENIIALITKYRDYSVEKARIYKDKIDSLEFMLAAAELGAYQRLLDDINEEIHTITI